MGNYFGRYNPLVSNIGGAGKLLMVDYVNTSSSATIYAGTVVVLNNVAYFVVADIAPLAVGSLALAGGVWAGNKDTSTFTLGCNVYYNATGNPVVGTAGTGCFTTTAQGNVFAGYCVMSPQTALAAVTGDQLVYFAKDNDVAGNVSNHQGILPTLVTNVAGAAQTFVSLTLPAGSVAVGDRIKLRGELIGTTRTASDTCSLVLKMGTTTIATLPAAFAHATTNFLTFDFELLVTAIGTGGTMVGTGYYAAGIAGATFQALDLASTTINTTIAEAFTITGTFSASNTTDQITVNIFDLEISRN